MHLSGSLFKCSHIKAARVKSHEIVTAVGTAVILIMGYTDTDSRFEYARRGVTNIVGE